MSKISFGFNKLKKKRSGRLSKNYDFDAQSRITSAPYIADIDGDGKKEIIFGTKKGRLFVLDNELGIKWFYDSKEDTNEIDSFFMEGEGSSSIEASPSIGDVNGNGRQEIVFGTELGIIYVLNEKGKVVWKYKAKGAVRGQVLLYDLFNKGETNVIFGCGDKKLYVLDNKGNLIWTFDAGSPIQSTSNIMIKNSFPHIIFGCDEGTIFCVNPKGDMVWKFKTDDKVIAQPAIGKLLDNDRLFVVIGSSDHKLYVLDDAGELLWDFKTEGAIVSKACLTDINNDHKLDIVFGSCDNNIYALNAQGDKIWSYETDFWIVTEPIVEDIDGDGRKEIIVGSYDHNIYVLDAEGSYILNYVPGLSGVVQQAGHYNNLITSDPGKVTGKKIWEFKTEGIIVGCSYLSDNKSIIVSTQIGKINELAHKKE